ncbi:MAG: RluA family pseudouridine synthase [Bacteroides sp.]|nr:RluA family pseudouridine synthase [Bacteroides sp.]MDE5805150.1 RluA family pseudouridine synthase [Paramuribaculum sp.]MBD5320238.1 RluA family pseudouridine synthase [Bacteroides sp.]MBD5350761.1 RluA family pseudouridine synthase [Bacteroides sp.]MBD5421869.1 RluA family pseudouridine synthase [Bacteroides sp.]
MEEQKKRTRFKPDVIKTFDVAEPARLMEFVASALPEIKRTRIKQMLAHNQVAVNGTPQRQFDLELQPGDSVKVNFVREFKVFSHRRMKIVYEDDDIIIINKGYGLLSMGNDKVKEGTAYSILKDYVKWSNPANKIFIVHRLDRDTSGLMMFAKTPEAKEAMQHNWNNMVLNRKYLAVVEGAPEEAQGTIRSYLVENSKFEVYSTDNPEEGQLAVTRYKTLSAGKRFALLEVELDTGRKNQIRVHMKDLGHPISGDRKYGASPSPIHRLCLHAQTLRFIHPVTRREMNFTTPVPSSFATLSRR